MLLKHICNEINKVSIILALFIIIAKSSTSKKKESFTYANKIYYIDKKNNQIYKSCEKFSF